MVETSQRSAVVSICSCRLEKLSLNPRRVIGMLDPLMLCHRAGGIGGRGRIVRTFCGPLRIFSWHVCALETSGSGSVEWMSLAQE